MNVARISRPDHYYELTDFGFPDIRKSIIIYVTVVNMMILIILGVVGTVIVKHVKSIVTEEKEIEKEMDEIFNFPTDLGTIVNHHLVLINIENLLEIITADPNANAAFDVDSITEDSGYLAM